MTSPYRFDVAQKAVVEEIREDQWSRRAYLRILGEGDHARDELIDGSQISVSLKDDEKRETRVGDTVKIRITIERDE